MHEASLARYVFDIVNETLSKDESTKKARVTKLIFSIGKPYYVSSESFEFYFTELVKGSNLEGASLDFTEGNEEGFILSSIEIDDETIG